MRMKLQTLLLWLASAKEQWVWSIFSAWRVGSSHKSKKNHQALKTRMWDLSTGRDSNAKFAKTCILTLLKLERPSTKSSIKLMKSLLKPVETTFFLNPCRWTRTLLETSICWLWAQSSPNSSWEGATKVKSESTIFQSVGATQSSNVSKTDSTSRTTLQNSEPSSFLKISWG